MPRRFTPAGRMVVAGAVVAITAVAACALIPTRYGFGQEIAPIPNDELTPGKVAETNQATVCDRRGGQTYSQAHRLTTTEMKREVFQRYGMPVPKGAARVQWEVDHRVPLALGGADDLENLWPEPGDGHGTIWTYHIKDRLELRAWQLVCRDHQLTLEAAQALFLAPTDWRRAYCRYVGGEPCGRP